MKLTKKLAWPTVRMEGGSMNTTRKHPSMTVPEMYHAIESRTDGTNRGSVSLRGLADGIEASVEVRIIRPRWMFGRIDVLVTPVAGTGEWWIDLERLQPAAGEGGEV